MQKNELRKRYDREYVAYDRTRSGWVSGYVGLTEQKVILRHLKGNTILEIGSGTGRYASLLKNQNYVGIDLSRKMIGNARRKASVVLLSADGENLPFQDGVFDSVICSRTFRFLPEPLKALKEARRVLKKRGRCVVSVDFLKNYYLYRVAHFIFKKYPYETHYRCKEIVDLYIEAGFKTLSQNLLFNLPETIYSILPHRMWKLLQFMDAGLKRLKKGWFFVIVGERSNA